MKKISSIIILIFSVLPVFSQASSIESHPIDIEMERCIAQDTTQSVEAVAHCEIAALKSWKAEVTQNYDKLLAILAEIDQKKLKEAQKQWLLYVETESNFARNVYNDKQKFPYGVVPLSRTIDIWRQRAAELKEYYDLLTN